MVTEVPLVMWYSINVETNKVAFFRCWSSVTFLQEPVFCSQLRIVSSTYHLVFVYMDLHLFSLSQSQLKWKPERSFCKYVRFSKLYPVNQLQLDFTDWFVYNLVILIKLCKTRYLNLEKTLLFPRNQVICLKCWKLWRAPATVEFNIFCWNFLHVSYLKMSTKVCSEFFLFCLDLDFLKKCEKRVWKILSC